MFKKFKLVHKKNQNFYKKVHRFYKKYFCQLFKNKLINFTGCIYIASMKFLYKIIGCTPIKTNAYQLYTNIHHIYIIHFYLHICHLKNK